MYIQMHVVTIGKKEKERGHDFQGEWGCYIGKCGGRKNKVEI